MNLQPLDPPRIGVEHLEFELAGPATISPRPAPAAIAVIRPPIVSTSSASASGRSRSQRLGDFVNGARASTRNDPLPPARFAGARPRHARLDVADDRLYDVLDRDESVRAAVLVDHSAMCVPRPAFLPEDPARHRGGQIGPAAGSRPRKAACSSRFDARGALSNGLGESGGANPNFGRTPENRRNRGCESCPEDRRASRRKPETRVTSGAKQRQHFTERRVACDARMSARGTMTSAPHVVQASTFLSIARSCGVKSALESAPSSASSMSSAPTLHPTEQPRRRSNRLPCLSRPLGRALGPFALAHKARP